MPQENEVIDLIRSLPRKSLSPQAAENILNRLRSMEQREAYGAGRRYRWMRRTAISMALLAFVVGLIMIPYLASNGGENNWIARLFPVSPPSSVWEVSPKFDLVEKDGSVVYTNLLRGIKGKIAYSEFIDVVANAPETVGKMFWYVWGDRKQLTGARLIATAVNQDTGKTFTVNESTLQGWLYGADAHTVTSFNPFPSKGLWRMNVTIGDQPYGSFIVPVKDEYIHTTTTHFLVSKDDAVAGKTETTLVVDGDRKEQTLEVRVIPVGHEDRVRSLIFHKGETFIQVSTMKPITHYAGTLEYSASGQWQIEVLGEKTTIQVK